MRNWLLKLKCDVKKQNHPTVSQNFEENEKSTKRFWANVIFVYGRTCKTHVKLFCKGLPRETTQNFCQISLIR